MASLFDDKEFESACAEILAHPPVEAASNGKHPLLPGNWEDFLHYQPKTHPDSFFHFYRRQRPSTTPPAKSGKWSLFGKSDANESQLMEYQVVASVAGLTPEKALAVYMDVEYRKHWNTGFLEEESGIVGPLGASSPTPTKHFVVRPAELTRLCVKYPWPLKARDYVFAREARSFQIAQSKLQERQESGISSTQPITAYTVISKITPNIKQLATQHKLKPASNHVTIDQFEQTVGMYSYLSGGKQRCLLYLRIFEDPKAYIPTRLVNWACASALPSMMDRMMDAFRGYDEWCSSQVPRPLTTRGPGQKSMRPSSWYANSKAATANARTVSGTRR